MKQHSLVPNLRAGAADSQRKLLFVDAYARRPYTESTSHEVSLKPAQTSVLRVARALAQTFDITVGQRGFETTMTEDSIRYCGLEAAQEFSFDTVVALRSPALLRSIAENQRGARLILWSPQHPDRSWTDVPTNWWRDAKVQLVCPSESVRRVANQTLHRLGRSYLAENTHVINDPILEDWVPDRTPRQTGRLLCLTPPDRGLDEALRLFTYCRQRIAGLTLRVGSVSSHRPTLKMPEGAEDIGPLNEAQLIDELRRAQALFAVQWSDLSPSGLLVCTANAVGTPVLAPCRGANPEMVSSSSQLLSGSDPDALVQKLANWLQVGFPVAEARPASRLTRVAAQWQRILHPQSSPWEC